MSQLNLNNCQVSNSLLVKDVVISNSLSFNNSNNNIGIGSNTLSKNTTGNNNTCIGNNSLSSNTSGNANTVVGNFILEKNTIGTNNIGVGIASLQNNTEGSSNVAIGIASLQNNTIGNDNTAIGLVSLLFNTTGNNNTGVGSKALLSNTTGSNNTAIGNNALINNTTFSNVTGLGANSTVTGSNQVQLGDSTSNVYAQSALNIRSDLRDKTDIRDTVLGLDFINKLRPVDFRWDMREDYIEQVKDGSKKRDRFHHGLIAQEVKSTMDNLNVDFAGYQDHKINGGKDVLTIGYEELIGPLIKSIQELTAEIAFLKSQLQK